jgi:hypothetical protein
MIFALRHGGKSGRDRMIGRIDSALSLCRSGAVQSIELSRAAAKVMNAGDLEKQKESVAPNSCVSTANSEME